MTHDWLRHFRLLLWNRWTACNETWQEERSKCPLPSLCFFGLIGKTRWPPWPICQNGGTLYSGARYVALWASCYVSWAYKPLSAWAYIFLIFTVYYRHKSKLLQATYVFLEYCRVTLVLFDYYFVPLQLSDNASSLICILHCWHRGHIFFTNVIDFKISLQNDDKTVGFIGLGNMGNHMAQNLVNKGYSLVVFDVNEASVLELQSAGTVWGILMTVKLLLSCW